MYQEEGIVEPKCIRTWTQEQYNEQNPIAAWFHERVIAETNAWVPFKDVYASYLAWCNEEGETAEKDKKKFTKALVSNDNVEKERRRTGRGFRGIRLGVLG
jgi:phage/plasmid-associated DNA primase